MLLVLAALLFADEDLATPPETAAAAAAPAAAQPAPPAEEPKEEEPGGPPRTAEASMDAAAGLRGERRASVSARTEANGVAFSLGVVRSAGPKAPERDELRFSLRTPHAHAEVRAVPDAALYAPPATVWRVPMPHFCAWDINKPCGLSANALVPAVGASRQKLVEDPSIGCAEPMSHAELHA